MWLLMHCSLERAGRLCLPVRWDLVIGRCVLAVRSGGCCVRARLAALSEQTGSQALLTV